MVIRGLSSFIQKNSRLSKPFKLHDTKVVIDGSNLVFSLYVNSKQDFSYGGEYERYYECVRIFMSSFLECNIKPIIVFTGGREQRARTRHSSIRKNEDIFKHALIIARGQTSSYPAFPLLIYEMFYSVLFDLGIPLANCDNAADGQVASLGNYYDCPVISSNGDFYIFDAYKGFIQLDSIDTKINFDIDSDGKEYKFLNCKIYYIDEFVKDFPGLDKQILPLFGTLIGNEFVKRKRFRKFFEIQLHNYKKNTHREHEGLLCWLQHKTLNEAVNVVTSYFKEIERTHIMSLIDKSVCRYQINPCSLTFIFDQKIDDFRNNLLSNSMLVSPCKNKLPQDFVLKIHQGHLPSFFINITSFHSVFLQAQVEDMELGSSHSCSSYIRRILYGILVRHDVNGTKCRNKACLGHIKEYDLKGSGVKRKNVLSLSSAEGIGKLPKINEVHNISKEQCIAIIAKALGVRSDYFLHIPDEWQLFIGCINCWLRVSGCSSKDLISAVILNLIYFGLIKSKNPFPNQERCPKKMPISNKCDCCTITCIATNVNESDLQYAGKMLEIYYINPMLKPDRRLFLNVAHNFSQLQSCLLYITYLNQLLNECFENPAPQKCFSGAMLCNLTAAITNCSFSEVFIEKLLGRDLYQLYSHLKIKICENGPNF